MDAENRLGSKMAVGQTWVGASGLGLFEQPYLERTFHTQFRSLAMIYYLNFARKRQFKGFVAQQIKIIQQWFSTQSHGYLDLNVGPAGNCKF
jgi:hypothetical protein